MIKIAAPGLKCRLAEAAAHELLDLNLKYSYNVGLFPIQVRMENECPNIESLQTQLANGVLEHF